MAYYGNILEEELKNKVAQDLFAGFDTTQIIGRVDFCVSIPADPLGLNEAESLFWAEAKKGISHDIYESIIQLILTLGKERPQDTILPPAFIGAFDAEKMAFLPYSAILDVLRQNDFNWNVAPSDHNTKEFLQLKELLNDALHNGLEIYNYEKDAKELAYFIKRNFHLRKIGVRHIRINKNNFTHIYLKWLEAVKPTININWDIAKKAGIIDADFYLADILSKENNTLGEKLFVLLQNVSQQYIAAELGENWQEEYYVWDCCAGTGNLLAGLTNKYNIYASTLDKADVQAMLQRIEAMNAAARDKQKGGANLLESHVFQFDFLNDPLLDETDKDGNITKKAKLPNTLQDIIRDPEKRKKLVIYINPPYAEASNARGTDFQHSKDVYITLNPYKADIEQVKGNWITKDNIIPMTIFFTVRHCIDATWLNDRDQFLYPNDGWQDDKEFQSNCLVFALFHGQNRISNEHGTNYWIPFTEEEVDSKEKFESHFMSDYINGKLEKKEMTAEEREVYERDGKNYHQADAFEQPKPESSTTKGGPLVFSSEAQAVMDAGRELWRYYHKQPNANPNASFYDIRLHFQGTKTTKSGKLQMNTESQDKTYTLLISDLRQKLKELAKKIEPKVYEYGFLKQ